MLELVKVEKNESPPEYYRVKPLSRVTFIGLLNSFDYARNFLSKLKEQGSMDILEVKTDLLKAKDQLFQIYLEIGTILNSYKYGFSVEGGAMDCEFCNNRAFQYRDFHKWCEDCFHKEYGGDIKE
jgi:hypothetical protein